MTQLQLDRTVARRTGESLTTVRRLGFHLRVVEPADLPAGELRLVVDCPSCRQPVPYPGYTRDGSPVLAECADARCDLLFDFDPALVYAAEPVGPRLASA